MRRTLRIVCKGILCTLQGISVGLLGRADIANIVEGGVIEERVGILRGEGICKILRCLGCILGSSERILCVSELLVGVCGILLRLCLRRLRGIEGVFLGLSGIGKSLLAGKLVRSGIVCLLGVCCLAGGLLSLGQGIGKRLLGVCSLLQRSRERLLRGCESIVRCLPGIGCIGKLLLRGVQGIEGSLRSLRKLLLARELGGGVVGRLPESGQLRLCLCGAGLGICCLLRGGFGIGSGRGLAVLGGLDLGLGILHGLLRRGICSLGLIELCKGALCAL